ncbi:MAG: hypothetical protein Q7T78_02875 [Rhodoferax sp.]|nr:hypothetical protein [Rhodoferax sp.]
MLIERIYEVFPPLWDVCDDIKRLQRAFMLMRHIVLQPALTGVGGRELATSAFCQNRHRN